MRQSLAALLVCRLAVHGGNSSFGGERVAAEEGERNINDFTEARQSGCSKGDGQGGDSKLFPRQAFAASRVPELLLCPPTRGRAVRKAFTGRDPEPDRASSSGGGCP